MAVRFAPTFVATVALLLAGTVAAVAQSSLCERYRAELASLQNAGNDPRARQYEQAAQRQRVELDRTRAYFRQLGCDRGRFLFFGDPPSPECGPLSARIRQMEGNLDQLLRQADQFGGGPGLEARRRHLAASIDQACRPGGGQPRGFFESIFGGGEPRPDGMVPEIDATPPGEGQHNAGLGGGRAVCVRSCDGYFFPLSVSSGGRDGAREMCRSLCPGTETDLYFMPSSGEIEQALSATGQPYTSLPNASRYKKAYDANCTCRAEGQSWAQALQTAEELLERRKTDIIVTAEKAEELSRPRAAETRKGKDAKGKPAPADADLEVAGESAAALPTGGQESAGIGVQDIKDDKTLGQREGLTREVTAADGSKRRVRIVAPNVIAVPQGQAQTRTP